MQARPIRTGRRAPDKDAGMFEALMSELRAIIYCLFLLLFDSLCLLRRPPKAPRTMRKILLVRLDAIGDFVLWLDAAKAMRRLYPPGECEIFLLGNLAWCDLARELPYFDQVLPLDRGRFTDDLRYRRSLLKELRRAAFDTVIQPTYSREFFQGDEVVRISGAPERIGFAGDCTNTGRLARLLSDRCYTRLVPATAAPLMELERNAEFLRGLGLAGFQALLPDLRFLVRKLAAPVSGEYYVIVPGAGMPVKRWPADNFLEVARRLHRLTGWPGVVCGSVAEADLASHVEREAGVPLQSLAGRTSLLDLIAVIAGAEVVVGNDSAAMHLAAALGTPAVCVLGGAQYGRFLPYGVAAPAGQPLPRPVVHRMDCFCCDWRCIYKLTRDATALCVALIAVDAVMDAVAEVLPLPDPPSR